MRDLIIARLEEIRVEENNFSSLMSRQWANMFVKINDKLKHISEVEWTELDDDALLNVFERVIIIIFLKRSGKL